MFVLSRVVVGLARQKKELETGKRLFCTYNSILDFYVLIVNWGEWRCVGRWSGGGSLGFLVLLMASSRASLAPTGFVLFT
ncbi:MAG: hypothetical protein Q7T27_09650, partial [Pseudomonas sp.]|uniref:hypothetical protein n=1 Tax=Pseudomonas sp. TaxID=306 RepID=UPI0027234FA5